MMRFNFDNMARPGFPGASGRKMFPWLGAAVLVLGMAAGARAQFPPPRPGQNGPEPGRYGRESMLPAPSPMGGVFSFVEPLSGVNSHVVKGAPFSAQVVRSSTQKLADGNMIERKSTGTIARDVAGRTRREMTLEMFPGDDALADQLEQLDRRLERTIGGSWFAIRDGDGVAARAWPLGRDGVGQVEDVATSPTRRGQGLARAVVSAAARASHAAGNDLTFVIADDGDTTPQLYGKTGFEPLGFKWRFVKRL